MKTWVGQGPPCTWGPRPPAQHPAHPEPADPQAWQGAQAVHSVSSAASSGCPGTRSAHQCSQASLVSSAGSTALQAAAVALSLCRLGLSPRPLCSGGEASQDVVSLVNTSPRVFWAPRTLMRNTLLNRLEVPVSVLSH